MEPVSPTRLLILQYFNPSMEPTNSSFSLINVVMTYDPDGAGRPMSTIMKEDNSFDVFSACWFREFGACDCWFTAS